jgi:hypothetical protein
MEAELTRRRNAGVVKLRNIFHQLHGVGLAMINLQVIADEEVVIGILTFPRSPWDRDNGRHSLV